MKYTMYAPLDGIHASTAFVLPCTSFRGSHDCRDAGGRAMQGAIAEGGRER